MALGLVAFHVNAHKSETLSVDRVVPQGVELAFPNEDRQQPKIGDFDLEHYVLMSNDKGERWAVLTLTNLSKGLRILDHQHLMALFADGSRSNPKAEPYRFRGQETQTITVSFGVNKFPILSVYTRNSQ